MSVMGEIAAELALIGEELALLRDQKKRLISMVNLLMVGNSNTKLVDEAINLIRTIHSEDMEHDL